MVEKEEKRVAEDLEETIYDERQLFFDDVFYQWMDYKVNLDGLSERSFDRYLSDKHRFFDKGSRLERIPFDRITEEDVEFFIRNAIIAEKLTHRGCARIKLILRGVFRFGYRRKMTKLHIGECLDNLEISKCLFAKRVVEDEKEVFTREEEELIFNKVLQKPSLTGLGLLLLFYTGLRIGELAVLREKDIFEDYICVSKTETCHDIRDEEGRVIRRKYEVKPFPKTEAGVRRVVIPPAAISIIEMIREKRLKVQEDYLFVGRGGRMHAPVFSQKLRNLCNEIGIPQRSAHKIRKTYATRLINAGLEKSIIVKQMGHTDFSITDRYYYFNDAKKEYIRTRITNAFV